MARPREETLKAKREGMARRRAADIEGARAYSRAYHAKNREHQRAKLREYYAKRFFWSRAMKLRGEGRATYLDLAKLWRTQRGRCVLTGRRLNREAQLDHIKAKARGGGDGLANLRWVCAEVNLAKRDMTDAEFSALCREVVEALGAEAVAA